jgi:hypothetical protein
MYYLILLMEDIATTVESLIREGWSALADDPDADVEEIRKLLHGVLGCHCERPELTNAIRDFDKCFQSSVNNLEGLIEIAGSCEPLSKLIWWVSDVAAYRPDETFRPVLEHLGLGISQTWNAILQRRFTSVAELEAAIAGQSAATAWEKNVVRLLGLRNLDAHCAADMSKKQAATALDSICGSLLLAVHRQSNAITRGLLRLHSLKFAERVIQRFDKWKRLHVPLEGIEVDGLRDETGELVLEALEVLKDEVTTDSPHGTGEEGVYSGSDAKLDDDADELATFKVARRGRVTDLIAMEPTSIILGAPGGGKTFTLQFCAASLAKAWIDGKETRLPVYVELNRCGPGFGIKELLMSELNEFGADYTLYDLIPHLALFLDGLNEVALDQRLAVSQEIKALFSAGGRLKAVVSSRPGSWNRPIQSAVFRIEELSDKQMLEFLFKRMKDPIKARAFMRQLNANPKIKAWGRAPLGLAMLATVGGMPKNRGRLMKAFVDQWFQREEGKELQRVPRDVKRRALDALAFESRLAGTVAFSYEFAVPVLSRTVANLGSLTDAAVLLEEARHNGFLVCQEDSTFAFSHELYQELFAAEELMSRSKEEPDLAVKLAGEPMCDGALVLFSGLFVDGAHFIRRISEHNTLLAARAVTADIASQPELEQDLIAIAARKARVFENSADSVEGLLALLELGAINVLVDTLKDIRSPNKQHKAIVDDVVRHSDVTTGLSLLTRLESEQGRVRILCDWVFFALAERPVEDVSIGSGIGQPVLTQLVRPILAKHRFLPQSASWVKKWRDALGLKEFVPNEYILNSVVRPMLQLRSAKAAFSVKEWITEFNLRDSLSRDEMLLGAVTPLTLAQTKRARRAALACIKALGLEGAYWDKEYSSATTIPDVFESNANRAALFAREWVTELGYPDSLAEQDAILRVVRSLMERASLSAVRAARAWITIFKLPAAGRIPKHEVLSMIMHMLRTGKTRRSSLHEARLSDCVMRFGDLTEMNDEEKAVQSTVHDYLIRKIVPKTKARVLVQCAPTGVRITIVTDRPGSIIGKKGANVHALRDYIAERIGGGRVKIRVVEEKTPGPGKDLVSEAKEWLRIFELPVPENEIIGSVIGPLMEAGTLLSAFAARRYITLFGLRNLLAERDVTSLLEKLEREPDSEDEIAKWKKMLRGS